MSNWVLDINAELDNCRKARTAQSQEQQCRKKPSIYKLPPLILPPDISDEKKKAYLPRAVSFGPYHYGEPHLIPMEAHKQRALLHVLDKWKVSLDTIFNSIVEVVQELKESYDSLESKWQKNTEKFVQLMIMDGFFMLEILRVAYRSKNYYSCDDPIFSEHGDTYAVPFIKVDMLLLENQLPMLLLIRLKAILKETEPNIKALNEDILNLLGHDIEKDSNMGECLHVLDFHRKALLNPHKVATPQSPNQGEENNKRDGYNVVPPATELHEAGVCIKKSKSKSLQDITFNCGILKLPNFIVDDCTESMFLNLIAFEHCHIPAGSHITSFIAFMDRIIDDDRDIKLLSSKGIITNYIGTNKEAADLFNTMSKNLVMETTGNLNLVYNKLIKHSNEVMPKWRANLMQTYCRSPWAIISVIAALIIFSLTVVQTIFTISN